MDELETEIKRLIISVLNLEDTTVADIKSDEALFVDGLGLDSIDALELGIAMKKKFGLNLSPDSKQNQAHFANVASLARYIQSQKEKA